MAHHEGLRGARIEDFVLCLGYKAEHIRSYYELTHSNVLIELGGNHVQQLDSCHDEARWRVWLVDTGAAWRRTRSLGMRSPGDYRVLASASSELTPSSV